MNEEVKIETKEKTAEEVAAEVLKKIQEEDAKLNTAQKLARSMGLPYWSSPFKAAKPKKFRHKTFRNPQELAVKKREHARRVGRPK